MSRLRYAPSAGKRAAQRVRTLVNAGMRDAASGAAAAADAIEAAIAGDLVAASPALAEKFEAVESRLTELEAIP